MLTALSIAYLQSSSSQSTCKVYGTSCSGSQLAYNTPANSFALQNNLLIVIVIFTNNVKFTSPEATLYTWVTGLLPPTSSNSIVWSPGVLGVNVTITSIGDSQKFVSFTITDYIDS